MKVPSSWLRELCDPGLDLAGIVHALEASGTEVERTIQVGVPSGNGNGSLFRVGRVLAAEQHPDADRLKVCRVEIGGDTRTIVCGAPNVAPGEVVLVALPGAVLPDGTRLGQASLRGVRSEGMILSESEVQLGSDAAGIMVLPDSFEVGEEASRYLPLGDDVIELAVSPNRPDCLAVYGVAREVHAATGAPLAPDPSDEDAAARGEGEGGEMLDVTVEDQELCPRFSVRVFTDVQIGPSPLWLKARLTAAGQRPINNVVDITNYVMLLVGQPMHVYDLDRLAGPALIVRHAADGERLVTLDGQERTLDPEMLVVCDAEGPSGIGGVMGGAASEVSPGTTRVAMEAATWNGPNILRTSSRLALRTEASARFEKGLPPELALRAQRLAARLMVELCGARLVPGAIDVAAPTGPAPELALRTKRIEALLGERIDPEESKDILERLQFAVERSNGDLRVEVPFFRRGDVTREADLVEEVARIHGLERLPATLPARERAIGGLTRVQKRQRLVEDVLRDRGLSEAITYSFIAPEWVDRLGVPKDDLRRRLLRVSNPLSEEQAVMRPTLVPGLLNAVRHNLARDVNDVRIFEVGRVFFSNGQDRLPDERLHLGLVIAGAWAAGGWRSAKVEADFYLGKALLEALLGALGIEDWTTAGGGPAFLHPERSATVVVDGAESGWLGELHPAVARAFSLDDLARTPVAVELELGSLLERGAEARRYVETSTHPAVFEDIAVVVEESVPADTVVAVVRSGGGAELRSALVFDVYRGDQVGEGHKSLALRLEFGALDRTLTDEEVAERREGIRARLAEDVGGRLRE